VGKNTDAFGTAGIVMRQLGIINITRASGSVLNCNRTGSDGALVEFYKNSTSVVGNIGTRASYVKIGSGDTNLLFNSAANAITPEDAAANSNGVLDLGRSTSRFKDLYLSGGVVFGPASASNVSSQTLDSYEEGNFSLTTTTSGVTISSQSCIYTKVGRLVTLSGALTFSALPSNISTIHFSGAPFNCWAQHNIGIVREASTTGAVYILQINANNSTFGMNSMDGVANGSTRIFGVNENYSFVLTYTTA
jgi:hypothetical protein